MKGTGPNMPTIELLAEIAMLTKENERLRAEVQRLNDLLNPPTVSGTYTYVDRGCDPKDTERMNWLTEVADCEFVQGTSIPLLRVPFPASEESDDFNIRAMIDEERMPNEHEAE